MKKIIYTLFFFLLVFSVCDAFAGERKREKEGKKKKEWTPYQKLFEGKQVQTARGLMTIHKIGDKVYVEFPVRLLNKEMLFTSSIENISDCGESAVGEFSGPGVPLTFTLLDSMLQARLIIMDEMRNLTNDASVASAILKSNRPGVYDNYKVEAYTPDSSAMVVDMSSLFMKHTIYTTPFTDYAGNSIFGLMARDHKFQEDRTYLKGVKAYENNVVVNCEMGYNVDYIFFGMFLHAKDVKVSVQANRILMLLPEKPMLPRLADYRVGVEASRQSGFESLLKGVSPIYFTNRWRLEPVDREKYNRGELVEPLKPIVFYMDTLMPEAWKPYLKAGVEEWNQAFERIGFKNVIQVKDCPRNDPQFDMADVSHSTLLFSPVKMYDMTARKYCDPRTGEVLSASILIPIGYEPEYSVKLNTMTVNPRVRQAYLPVEMYGDLIKNEIAQQVGTCLGLSENLMASSAYPTDSLRSASFTQKYGLTPSVMDRVTCNYIAQPGDMEKGVRLTPKGLGEYDYFLIKWLYQPVPGITRPQDEAETLNRWVMESRDNPYCKFGRKIWSFYPLVDDPRLQSGDLGNDPMKALEYKINNVKYALQHFDEWYKEDDKTMVKRKSLRGSLIYSLKDEIQHLLAYVGGVFVHEVTSDEGVPAFTVVPKERQREIVRYALDISKNFNWLDDKDYLHETGFETASVESDGTWSMIMGNLLGKIGKMKLGAIKAEGAYSPDELMDDIYAYVWEGTLKRQALTERERFLQRSFVAGVMTSSAIAEPASAFEKEARKMPFIAEESLVSWKPDFRAFNRMESQLAMTKGNLPQQRGGFDGYMAIVKGYNTAPEYYNTLLRVQKLLQEAVVSSSGDTKLHYDYLLYRIRKAMSKK